MSGKTICFEWILRVTRGLNDAGSVLGTGVGGWLCREKSVTEQIPVADYQ
jgi:hypothetical protein